MNKAKIFVQNKFTTLFNDGREETAFDVYVLNESQSGYLYRGRYSVETINASDDECIEEYYLSADF